MSRGLGFLGAVELVEAYSTIDCAARGGTPAGWTDAGKMLCAVQKPDPIAPAVMPSQITVSPIIQTQISPQISPVFQQQFQPTGSPMTAGTAQTAGPAPTPGITGQSQLPPAPAPMPAAAPSYVPPPVQYAPPPAQLPSAPAPYSNSVEPTQPAQVTPALFDWKIAAIIGLGLFGVMALQGKRK